MSGQVGGQVGNANALVHGLYAKRLSKADLELIAELAKVPNDDMSQEIGAMRFVFTRAVAALGKRTKAADMLVWLDGITEAGVRLGNVLRAQRVLKGEGSESLAGAFAVALREIEEELGLGDG